MQQFVVQPQYAAGINWGNPITRGLLFAYLPGLMRDLVKNTLVTANSGVFTKIGSSIVTQGAVPYTGIITGTGPLLGPLSNSTIMAIAARYNGITNLSSNGSAIYCERAAAGNDIYKLGLGPTNSSQGEFTFRNDAASLIQPRFTLAPNVLVDNRAHFYMARVAPGVTESISDDYRVTDTFPGGAFTDAVTRTIGSDFGDTNSMWDGRIDLVAGWNRTLSLLEEKFLRTNPYQLFRIPPRPALLVIALRVTIYPISDVLTPAWYPSTGSTVYGVIDEELVDDADYAISPVLTAADPVIMDLSESIPASARTVQIRGLRTDSVGQIRVSLLNASNIVQGTSAWQVLTGAYVTYNLNITTTGASTRVRIEAQQ